MKNGGRDRLESQMCSFKEVLEVCELRDLGFSRPPFTWCNNRDEAHHILERLDHCLATTLWCLKFSNFSVRYSHAPYSDH